MPPAVSIVTPLFNRACLLEETIDSVISQSYERWEMLVVDDHSTDKSFDVATQKAREDPRIKVWKRRGNVKGAPACRNEGLSQATGDYVIFLDSDDLLSRDCLHQRLEAFSKLPSMDFLVFPGEQFDTKPGDLGIKWFSIADDCLTGFLEKPLWQTTAVIWKKDSLLDLGGFRENLLSWQDWDLHIRAFAKGYQFLQIDGPADSFVRRGHVTRISKQSEIKEEHLQQRSKLFLDTKKLLEATGNWNDRRRDLLIQRFIVLALLFDRAGLKEQACATIKSLKQHFQLSDTRNKMIRKYYNFETDPRFKNSLIGKLKRPFIKEYFRFRLGDCIAARSKKFRRWPKWKQIIRRYKSGPSGISD